MFIMDSVRGMDSCGLTLVSQTGGVVDTHKEAVLPHTFVKDRRYKNLMGYASKVIIGHNRWATAGVINSKNAHPFTVGNITGQHNGTLLGQYLLPDSSLFEVDSENIIHSIDKLGITETWKLVDGAAALMWWDDEAETFNMLRNDERELYFCYSKDLKTMYAASEEFMLKAALVRNKLPHHDIEKLPTDTLYSFKVNSKAKIPQDYVKCTTRKLTPLPLGSSHYYNSYGKWWDARDVDYSSGNTSAMYESKPMIGDKIDFMVSSIVTTSTGEIYKVKDNDSLESYVIETYKKPLDLKIGDCRTSRISYFYSGDGFLSSHDVAEDSKYIMEVDDIEFDEPQYPANCSDYDGVDTPVYRTDCSWCSSPIQKGDDVVITEEGEIFCETCASSSDTDEYMQTTYHKMMV